MLQVIGLSYRYSASSDELFDGLEHTFPPGAVTAVSGASGRGKSTLLYVLGLMLRPTAGAVRLDGREVSALSDTERSTLRARRFGFVFQDAALPPSRIVLDAVAEPALYAGMTRDAARRRAHGLLGELGLDHRARHRPGTISGGQAQRVAVCRALVNDPPVVLADEPTGNLDRDNARAVLDALRQSTAGGRTVAIATHDPFVIDQADHVLAL